jgi:hypothetical protein
MARDGYSFSIIISFELKETGFYVIVSSHKIIESPVRSYQCKCVWVWLGSLILH